MGRTVIASVVMVLAVAGVAGGLLSACDVRLPIGEPEMNSVKSQPPTASQSPQQPAQQTAQPPAQQPPSSAPVDTQAVRQELLARWNAAADATITGFDFHWQTFDQFPHPTYKGGSAQAYGDFAEVLLAFFQRGDDFDFLAANHLFTLHLVYIFPSGQSGLDTTFEALAKFFAAPGGYGDVPDSTRQALQGFLDRMNGGSSPTTQPPVDQHPDAGTAAGDPAYEAMCRSYCEALRSTAVIGCVNAGGSPTACAAQAVGTETCYQVRCVPKLISPALCSTQCDDLAPQYGALCSSASPPAALCPTSPADHDRACHAACVGS